MKNRGLSATAPQDWVKQRLHSWRAHIHWDPHKAEEVGLDLPVSLGESPGEVRVGRRSVSWGPGHWRQWSERVLIDMSSHRGHHFDIKTWPYPATYRLQCGNASGQTASRIGTYCYPSADKLSEAVLNSQLPLNTV